MKRLKFRGIFSNFLFSYLMILIIPVTIWCLSNLYYHKVISDQEIRFNQDQLKQAQLVIDEQLKEIDQYALNIMTASSIINSLYVRSTEDIEGLYTVTQAVRELSSKDMARSGISMVYVYLRNTDVILCPTGKYSREVFYSSYLPKADMNFERWNGWLQTGKYKWTTPVLQEDSNTTIMMSIPLPMGTWENPHGMLVIHIDTERIARMLPDFSDGFAALMDESRTPLIGTGREQFIRGVAAQLSKQDKSFETKVNNRTMLVELLHSTSRPWIYISAVPMTTIREETNKVLNTMLLTLALGVILAFALSLALARHHAGPLRQLLKIFDISGEKKTNYHNDVRFITEEALKLVKENKDIKKKLQEQAPSARNDLFMRLLRGEAKMGNQTGRILETLDIDFPDAYFCSAVLTVREASGSRGENLSLDEKLLHRLLVSDIVREAAEAFGRIYVAEVSLESIAVIFNFKGTEEDTLWVRRVLESVRLRAAQRYRIFIGIDVGNTYSGTDGISRSFIEAGHAGRARFLTGDKSINFYGDNAGKSGAYVFPIEWKKQLLSLLLEGNEKEAGMLLETVFHENMTERKIAPEMGRYLLLDMSTCILGAMAESYACFSENGRESLLALMDDIIGGTSTAEYALAGLQQIVHDACKTVNASRRSHNVILKEKILSYVKENFTDSCLSLNSIANAVDITPTYLAHFFKEQTGSSLMDYVTNLRIARAKELLRNQGESLMRIAGELGYVNDTVFIRNFKKVEGMTPGKYRQLLSEDTSG